MQQRAGEIREPRDVVAPFGRALYPVKVVADADCVNTRKLDHVVDMGHDLVERGPDYAGAGSGIPRLFARGSRN